MFIGQQATPGRAAMTVALFTDERTFTAALRAWGAEEANRMALAVVWGRYSEDDARAALATHLAHLATQAKMRGVSCRALAAILLEENITRIDGSHRAVMNLMIAAVRRSLANNPRDIRAATAAATDLCRANGAPADLIGGAIRIARAAWRAA